MKITLKNQSISKIQATYKGFSTRKSLASKLDLPTDIITLEPILPHQLLYTPCCKQPVNKTNFWRHVLENFPKTKLVNPQTHKKDYGLCPNCRNTDKIISFAKKQGITLDAQNKNPLFQAIAQNQLSPDSPALLTQKKQITIQYLPKTAIKKHYSSLKTYQQQESGTPPPQILFQSKTQTIKANNINDQDHLGETPLHKAVRAGNIAQLEYLLKEPQLKLDIENFQGYTPLSLAIIGESLTKTKHPSHLRIKIISLLLKAGARPNYKPKWSTPEKNTPIHLAILSHLEYGSLFPTLLNLLKKYKSAFNIKDGENATPLYTLITSDNPSFDYIKPQSVLSAYKNRNHSAIHTLTRRKDVQINSHNIKKYTPLHALVSYYPNTPLALHFINRGADLEATEETGMNPLHTAIHFGRFDQVKLLIEHGKASLSSKDKTGKTPLEHAYQSQKEWQTAMNIVKENLKVLLKGKKSQQELKNDCKQLQNLLENKIDFPKFFPAILTRDDFYIIYCNMIDLHPQYESIVKYLESKS